MSNKKIQEMIISHCSEKWQKAAMVVAGVLCEKGSKELELDAADVQVEIIDMCESKLLVQRGNLKDIRASEIRLYSNEQV